ncbi:TIR domain-containing protein [Parasphingopyxis sp. CP4]|uniref:TIR domain-containing protein n=1 Tax=Parasphingopyxis sp. CP4 TaxID=2724527 RepID=UPI00159F909E|nr:TIR domain-containing protein [Parasphingopyxis sp. CP4]QLC22877.1 TIR domain-containing protein [Parasphingopyxis sp. CP4]
MAQENDASGGARQPIAFISHHSSQEKTARHLKTVLERNGVTGWMAPDDIDPGVAFDQAIIEQVERSDLIVLLFCSKSDQSRHVKRELMMAENNKKLIYPVRLEDIDAKGLAYWLNDYQWIDWIDRRDATIQRMIETIKRQVAQIAPPPVEETPVEPAAPEAVAETTPEAAPEPAQDPVPATPVGLMSSAGGDGDDGDAPKRLLGIPMQGKGWYAIGGIAIFGAILLGLIVNSLGGESEFKVQPGQWETTYEVDRVLNQVNVPQDEADAFIADFESEATTHCITEAEARSPGNDFFDPDRTNNCAMSNLSMDGGDFRVQLECQPPELDGVNLTVWMRGEYDEDAIVAEAEYAFVSQAGEEFRFVANQVGRYLGPCE